MALLRLGVFHEPHPLAGQLRQFFKHRGFRQEAEMYFKLPYQIFYSSLSKLSHRIKYKASVREYDQRAWINGFTYGIPISQISSMLY